MKTVAIIGAGASGLAACITLANYPERFYIQLFDSNAKIGRKIAATGNGRCNLSNAHISKERYQGDVEQWFDIIQAFDIHVFSQELGIMIRQIGDLYYPYSEQAKTVVQAFEKVLENHGIVPFLNTKITRIDILDERYILYTDSNKSYKADIVIMAGGGQASPVYGSDGTCFQILKKLKVPLIPLKPSLVQLKTEPSYPMLKGCRFHGVFTLTIDDQVVGQYKGEGLLTEDGISGIAMMQLSRFLDHRKAILHCNLVDEISEDDLENYYYLHQDDENIYEGIISLKLADFFQQHFQTRHVRDFKKNLQDFQMTISGTRGFASAQVTRGGVPSEALDEHLMLRNYPNMYVCGEIMNIDGDCGGFNLHAAFAFGKYVAQAIIEQS